MKSDFISPGISPAGGRDPDLAEPAAVRRAIRRGDFRSFTNHAAPGFAQGNLVIVPAPFADDFAQFCELNSRALPVMGRSAAGVPHLPELASDLDLRTDVGGYMVFENGVLTGTPRDIRDLWRDDLVAFVLGCSFSFESVLQSHGVRLRHLDEGNVSAMYVTNRATVPVGPFGGDMVVSMRPMTPQDAIRAALICQHYPEYHGAPVHIGLPHLLGIDDLTRSYGGHGLTALREDELPVFWACAATAQIAAVAAGLPLCITHYKAHMVLTDVPVLSKSAGEPTFGGRDA
ncbi:D-glutamate cyclase family protein [Telmatospirillum siberiense]|uniref:DUF1445 domain-containing protein n=1 Tax=Telmatospirillum siberiense TaxID=382514 RepID=A0A2N3PPS7_9PROT|nr:DUF1445 domain-containing protein [Telmatospirillum siberiense]PKU22413.1 hypothetical protein CWS72_21665 [Telmatospirillum siberiense]